MSQAGDTEVHDSNSESAVEPSAPGEGDGNDDAASGVPKKTRGSKACVACRKISEAVNPCSRVLSY